MGMPALLTKKLKVSDGAELGYRNLNGEYHAGILTK